MEIFHDSLAETLMGKLKLTLLGVDCRLLGAQGILWVHTREEHLQVFILFLVGLVLLNIG